jgi:CRISPR/Cas system-associated exonuclease Cas4 (RecB family)
MNCEYRQKKQIGEKLGGCIYEDSGKCQAGYFYYCIESMKQTKFILSFSSVRTFETCPRKFYYTEILGLKKSEQYLSVALRAGSYLHGLVENKGRMMPWFSEFEWQEQVNVEMLYRAIVDLELIPTGLSHEVEFISELSDRVKGIIDLWCLDYFGDLKLTSNPSNYLNNFIAYDQLAYYFLLSTPSAYAYMLPIRMPALKEGKDEDKGRYCHRLYSDILKRPKFYLPEYDKSRPEFKWGRKYYRQEFRLNELSQKITWTREEIRRAIYAGYFIQRWSNCMNYNSPCDYMSICESGAINDAVYEYRQTKQTISNKQEEDSL